MLEPVPGALERARLVVGSACLSALGQTRVILFGVGGVGSWCAEALVRSGVSHLTLVDPDVVAASNLNRQLQATPETLGQPKVETLAERLRAIWPGVDVCALQRAYSLDTRGSFALESFEYVIDAIDSLSNKVGLIQHAHEAGCRIFSSMGAGRRLDPTRVRVASLWETEGDRLARSVRRRLRRGGFVGDLVCVISDEPATPVGPAAAPEAPLPDPDAGEEPGGAGRPRATPVFGSTVPVTATFGMVLASLVIGDVARRIAEGT